MCVCVCLSNCVDDLEASNMRQSRPDVGCCTKENNCFVECKVCRYQLQMVFGFHFDMRSFTVYKLMAEI